jgi:hypothetical protein
MLSGNVLQFSEEHAGPSRSQPVAPPPETRGIFVPRAAVSRPRAAILSLSILAFTLDLSISHYLEIPLDSISLTEALPLFMCTVGFDKPLHLANAVPNPPHLLSPVTVTHALTLFSCKKKCVLLIFGSQPKHCSHASLRPPWRSLTRQSTLLVRHSNHE